MKKLLIFIFIINSCFSLQAQEDTVKAVQEEITKDSTVTKKKHYAFRVGADISKPIVGFTNDDDRTEFEIVADLRITKRLYAAAELGTSKKTTNEDYLTFSTEGSYIKIGANYNAYENWAGMNNEIYFGFRYGLSFFDQTLESYTPNAYGTYFVADTIESGTTYDGLTAHWVEFVAGLKVETLKNLYLGASISFKNMISTEEPDNFSNLYIPGFNRVFSNNVGIGFNYTISYQIPISKK